MYTDRPAVAHGTYVIAPLSTHLAVGLYDAWAGARRDRQQRALRAADLAYAFHLPPLVGPAHSVAAANDFRAQMIGLVLDIAREQGLPAGCALEDQVLDVFVRAMRRQTAAAWWVSLSPTPGSDLWRTLTVAESQDLETLGRLADAGLYDEVIYVPTVAPRPLPVRQQPQGFWGGFLSAF